MARRNLAGLRAELRAMLEAQAHDVARLGEEHMAALGPVLAQARTELNGDLARWVAAGKGSDRYTPQAYRSSLLAIEASERTIHQRLVLGMARALIDGARTARHLAGTHTANEFLLMAQGPGFTAAMPTVPARVAAALATAERAPMARYETSAARYAGQVAKDIHRELAVGVVRGETNDQLITRLQRLGGPRGVVALRGIAGTAGAITEVIPEGLFARYESWAERLVRTELASAYNVQLDDLYDDLHTDFPDLLRRWDATADARVCADCQNLHGVTIDPSKGETFPNDSSGPPLHPNCRCRAGLWRAAWSRFLD